MTALYRLPEVIKRTGLSRSSIYRMEAQGQFPSRVKLGARASAWRSESVQAWIDSRPRARDIMEKARTVKAEKKAVQGAA